MKAQLDTRPQFSLRVGAMLALIGIASCSSGTQSKLEQLAQQQPATSSQIGSYSEKANFRLNLTDAPNDDLKSVFVNVDHAELRLSGGGKEARVIVAKDLGAVDLLTLQNGVTLPMADVTLPENVSVTQIRLVLKSDNNYIIKDDGSRCDLKTPSEQKTGIKFLIHKGITIEKGFSYSIVADFDAKKSIVQQGNHGCLLKPVLKLKSASRIEVPPTEEEPDDTNTGGEEPGGGDTTTGGDGSTGGGTGSEDSGTDSSAGGMPGEEPLASEEDASQAGDESGFDGGAEEDVPAVPEEDLNYYF